MSKFRKFHFGLLEITDIIVLLDDIPPTIENDFIRSRTVRYVSKLSSLTMYSFVLSINSRHVRLPEGKKNLQIITNWWKKKS